MGLGINDHVNTDDVDHVNTDDVSTAPRSKIGSIVRVRDLVTVGGCSTVTPQMALPASAFEPLHLDADDDDDDDALIALDAPELDEASLRVPTELDEADRASTANASTSGFDATALTRPMAHRVLRDAIALQLARRGFDGLRMQPLTLVAEMAACFIGAIGTQLALAEPAPAVGPRPHLAPHLPLVLRLQRHTNLRTPAEWHKLKELFSRQTELNTMQGTQVAQLTKQKQPCLGGQPPPAVQQLYTALRATWHYKMTPAGRAAHVSSGHADGVARAAVEPNALQAALPPSELSQVVSLSSKARRTADAWLSGVPGTSASAAAMPTLFPGALLGLVAPGEGTSAPPTPSPAPAAAAANNNKRRKPSVKFEG